MLNRCDFIGNLGRDPEIRTFANGDKVAGLRLAVSERWKDKASGETREKTEWVSISVFSQGLVGVIEKHLKKGSRIFVSGKLETRKWQDQQGNDRYSTEVVIRPFGGTLEMLDGRRDAPADDVRRDAGTRAPQNQSRQAAGSAADTRQDYDDEIPF